MLIASNRMNTVRAFVGAAVLVAGCTSIPDYAPLETPAVYAEAVNAGDVDRALSLFASDAVWYVDGVPFLAGREEIEGYLEYDAATNAHVEISDVLREDSFVIFESRGTNDFLRELGIERVRSRMKFVVARGRVQHVEVTRDPEVLRKVEERMRAFMGWVEENRSETFQSLIADGRFAFDAERGRTVVQLARDWNTFGSGTGSGVQE